MTSSQLITIDPETMGGTSVFAGTRVPVRTLFIHLKKGIPLDEFLDDFPTMNREQAVAVLELAEKAITSGHWLRQAYESAA